MKQAGITREDVRILFAILEHVEDCGHLLPPMQAKLNICQEAGRIRQLLEAQFGRA